MKNLKSVLRKTRILSKFTMKMWSNKVYFPPRAHARISHTRSARAPGPFVVDQQKQDKAMRQKETLMVQGKIQQDILASLDRSVGHMQSLVAGIHGRVEALAGYAGGITPPALRTQCESCLVQLTEDVRAAEARLRRMQELQAEYHNSGLDQLPGAEEQ
jgi:hypothetical protein